MSLIIGVDGGGTNTRGVIADLKGNILAEASGGGSNYQTRGLSSAVREIKSVILGLIEEANARFDSVEEIVAGLAGVGRPTDRERLKRRLAGELPDEIGKKIYITTDLHVALYGAVGRGEGLIVNAGTGATAMGKDKSGEIERADGWGFLLGDEGSGFWIGLQGIKRSLRFHDGRGPSTDLKEIVRLHYDLEDIEEIVPLVYRLLRESAHDSIASLSKPVFEAAEEGDAVARSIVSDAGKKHGESAAAVMRKLDYSSSNLPIVLAGGVFSSSARSGLLESFEEEVNKTTREWRYEEPLYSPKIGALIFACSRISCENFQPKLSGNHGS